MRRTPLFPAKRDCAKFALPIPLGLTEPIPVITTRRVKCSPCPNNFWTAHIRCSETMERETGIEPVTSSLGSWRSTAELLPLNAFVSACAGAWTSAKGFGDGDN